MRKFLIKDPTKRANDAWQMYEEFHSNEHDGFATMPLNERGKRTTYTFILS